MMEVALAVQSLPFIGLLGVCAFKTLLPVRG